MAAVEPDLLYLFGGRNADIDYGTLFVYNVTARLWTHITDATGETTCVPVCLSACRCVGVCECVYVCVLATLIPSYIASCFQLRLFIPGAIPDPRHGHTLTAVDGKLYLFGGFSRERSYFADFLVYDPGKCFDRLWWLQWFGLVVCFSVCLLFFFVGCVVCPFPQTLTLQPTSTSQPPTPGRLWKPPARRHASVPFIPWLPHRHRSTP